MLHKNQESQGYITAFVMVQDCPQLACTLLLSGQACIFRCHFARMVCSDIVANYKLFLLFKALGAVGQPELLGIVQG